MRLAREEGVSASIVSNGGAAPIFEPVMKNLSHVASFHFREKLHHQTTDQHLDIDQACQHLSSPPFDNRTPARAVRAQGVSKNRL